MAYPRKTQFKDGVWLYWCNKGKHFCEAEKFYANNTKASKLSSTCKKCMARLVKTKYWACQNRKETKYHKRRQLVMGKMKKIEWVLESGEVVTKKIELIEQIVKGAA